MGAIPLQFQGDKMVDGKINKKDYNNQLIPLLLFDKYFVIDFDPKFDDDVKFGVFMYHNNMFYFIPEEDLPEEIDMRIPDSLQELEEYIEVYSFLFKKILMLPKDIIEVKHPFEDEAIKISVDDLLFIFMNILHKQESRSNRLFDIRMKGICNG